MSYRSGLRLRVHTALAVEQYGSGAGTLYVEVHE